MDACVTYTGAGNCGELSGALYLELFLSNLSSEQKKLVRLRSYPTQDEHRENSYVLVDSTVYDIWAGKQYKQARIKAKTGVVERLHRESPGIKSEVSQTSIELLKQLTLDKFSKLFDEEIAKDRKQGQMYVTFNNKDPSDYALWASDTFPYLFSKFKETVEDSYFITNQDAAKIIQEKIIKDFIYLVEELRQDVPATGFMSLFHTNKIEYTHEEITRELEQLIPDPLFVEFILAVSYKNSKPQQALELLVNLQSLLNPNSIDKLEVSLISIVSTMISNLSQVSNVLSQNTSTVPDTNLQPKDTVDVKSTKVDNTQKRGEELNAHRFFAEGPKNGNALPKNTVSIEDNTPQFVEDNRRNLM